MWLCHIGTYLKVGGKIPGKDMGEEIAKMAIVLRSTNTLNIIWGVIRVIYNKIHVNNKSTASCLHPSLIYCLG